MSTNCIRCVANKRTAADLLCDSCRALPGQYGPYGHLSGAEMNDGAGATVGLNANSRLSPLSQLWLDQSEWSQTTFGRDAARGPIGPLKHLLKEAAEAIANPGDLTEYADCLLLILDATRRAGFTLTRLLDAAAVKLDQNRNRAWPAPVDDEPVEHVR